MKTAFVLCLLIAICSATFTWKNCGSSSDPAKIASLSVSPDPIVLGNPITVAAAASLATTISNTTGKYSVALSIYKYVLGVPVYIPCVDGIGSCTIPDLCSVLHPHDCPVSKFGIPCECPFPAGSYNLPSTSFDTKNPNLSWLTDGSYSVSATVTDPSGHRVICLELGATLSPN
eukprot:TRINITY_DN15551_c0_g1_i1.p1 TRINITY_DN15551_c0_g1~~TRINITY_DN15551_c0_g1_i1.p1  ORF type:complete len:174 (+),score=33.44 TRINITY_DN15551_c0_g1_i1:58-579(+)